MTSSTAFAFRALRPDGGVEKGQFNAPSLDGARAAIERRGLLVLDVREVASRRTSRPSLPVADLAVGLRVLADLLEAGLPMARAIATLRAVAPQSWATVLPHLADSVTEGKSLGAAFRDAPVEIPALVVGMTIAGEVAGALAPAVRRAADVMESMAATRAALRSAMAYPIVLLLAGTGAIALLVNIVIPRFATILGDVGQALPPTTRLVLAASSAARAAALPALGLGLIVAVLWRAWVASAHGRRQFHEVLLRLPLLGNIRFATATARSSLTLASLLETGVPLRSAITLAARAGGDAALEARMIRAGQLVEIGRPMAAALREERAITEVALRLAHAGEESGRLAPMLRHAAKLEQHAADRALATAVRLVEPALILIFAGVVALVAAALLQAVYSVRPAV